MSKNLLLFFFLLPVFVGAQNLVFNPSFEDTVACPYDLTLIYYAQNWTSYLESPDYFNTCSQNPMADVPRNEWGYQLPATGNAYIGIGTWAAAGLGANFREVAGSQLLTPLVIGTKYYLSMKVCRTEKYVAATNNIGISFSTIPYNSIDTVPINNTSAIKATSVITDSMNWVLVKGSFVADSAYQYVMVGNFYDDQHTDTLTIPTDTTNLGWLFLASCYYVDDVCVSIDSSTCYDWNGIKPIVVNDFEVFPNPASDNIQINSGSDSGISYSLLTIIGTQILNAVSESGSTSLDISNIPEGIYFLRVQSARASLIKKIIITH